MLIPVISHFFFAKSMKHVKRKLIFICLLKWFKRVFHLAQHCNFMDFCCKNWAKKTSKREENWYLLLSVIFMSFHISKIYHKMLWLYKNWIRFHTFATGKKFRYLYRFSYVSSTYQLYVLYTLRLLKALEISKMAIE